LRGSAFKAFEYNCSISILFSSSSLSLFEVRQFARKVAKAPIIEGLKKKKTKKIERNKNKINQK